MSKKGKKTTVNNIQNLNLEIDYDKLADAIIKAQNRANSEEQPKEKIGLWKTIWHIIINKKEPQKAYTAYLMGSILSFILNITAILSLLFLAFIIAFIVYLCVHNQMHLVLGVIFGILYSFAFFIIGLICRACANEMSQEHNRDYIVAAFSGIIGFAALIVAIVALLK